MGDSILDRVSMETALQTVLEDEHRRHPAMTVPDLGKLLYQAVYGGDHWVRARQAFVDALRAEWEGALPEPSTHEAVQIIDPAGRTARLHLAEARARGLTLAALTTFLVEQKAKNGDPRRWRELVSGAAGLAAHGRIPFAHEQIRGLLKGFGPGHHSPGYGPAAYRLIHDVTDPRTVAWLASNGLNPIAA
ncbi:MAG: hypothetical protein JSW65_06000 [Candidatus Bipolaricaulota bacterium]|nr:MAG: hypothetical protein JSW65_06000 [Candidatus Bipolaricaulota bacterium]